MEQQFSMTYIVMSGIGKGICILCTGDARGIDGCAEWFGGARGRIKRRMVATGSRGEDEVMICNMHYINGMGLLYLFGVDGLVDMNMNIHGMPKVV